jgi:hypothetical protein
MAFPRSSCTPFLLVLLWIAREVKQGRQRSSREVVYRSHSVRLILSFLLSVSNLGRVESRLAVCAERIAWEEILIFVESNTAQVVVVVERTRRIALVRGHGRKPRHERVDPG